MTHTPGPWHADDAIRVLDANDNEVCLPAIGAQLFEAKANARLIASAPDMLAALKAAQPFIKDQQAFNAICSAIAKAEGR